jgi:hypothetical protein
LIRAEEEDGALSGAKNPILTDIRTYKVYRRDSHLDCWISGIRTEECADVLILILGNANMMVFLRRTGHLLVWLGINISCSNSTDASLAALYPGQLLYKELAICPFVASFGSPMLQLSLSNEICELKVRKSTRAICLTGSVEYESVVPNCLTILG